MPDSITPHRRPARDVRQLIIGTAAILLVVCGGALIAQPSEHGPFGPDSAWAAMMISSRTPWGVTAALALAVIGGGLVTSVITAAVTVILLARRRWRTAMALVATVSLASGASELLKVLVARPRPPGALSQLATFSYPSGHTMTAAAFATVFLLAVPRGWSWALGATWIIVIAWSRTYLGVHWLTDVAAGAVLGAGVALLVDGALARIGARVPWLRRPQPRVAAADASSAGNVPRRTA